MTWDIIHQIFMKLYRNFFTKSMKYWTTPLPQYSAINTHLTINYQVFTQQIISGKKAERDSITKQHNCNTPKSNRVGQSFSIKNIIQLNEHKKQTNQFKNEIIHLTIIVFCNERIFLRGMGERTLRLKGFLVGNSFERIGGYWKSSWLGKFIEI